MRHLTPCPFSLCFRWRRNLGSGIMASPCTPTGTGPARSRRRRTSPSTCSRSSESSPGGGLCSELPEWEESHPGSPQLPVSFLGLGREGLGGCAGVGGHSDVGEVVAVPWVTPWGLFAVGRLHPGFPSLIPASTSLSQLSLPHPHFPSLIPSFPCLVPPLPLLYPCFHPFISAFPPTSLLSLPPSFPCLSLPHPSFFSHILVFTPSSQLPPPYFSLSFVSWWKDLHLLQIKAGRGGSRSSFQLPPVLGWVRICATFHALPWSRRLAACWEAPPVSWVLSPTPPTTCVLFPTPQAWGYAVPVSLQPGWLLLRDHGHLCLPKFPAWGCPPGGGR